jgi:uncharacterized protein YcfL
MKKIQLFILYIILFLLTSCASTTNSRGFGPGTLHAIILADTNDKKIGASTKVDFNKFMNLAKEISNNTGMKLKDYSFKGNSLNHNFVITRLNNLRVNPNDVVIFYYAGHGVNPDTGTRWPSMILNGKSLELNFVVNTIQKKHPRLFLAIADTCNTFSNDRAVTLVNRSQSGSSVPVSKNYQELFLRARGSIVASGAKPGQLSWSDSKYGGLFTYQFLESLKRGLSSNQPNWHTIIKSAKATIKLPNGVTQEPQAKINIKGETQIDLNNNLEESIWQWLQDNQQQSSGGHDTSVWH